MPHDTADWSVLKFFILFPLFFLLLCIHYKLLVFWAGYFYMNVLSSQITTRTHCCTIATPSATTAASLLLGMRQNVRLEVCGLCKFFCCIHRMDKHKADHPYGFG